MDSPLISVIIPVYNVEAYFEKCLKSIINQTYKNLEIILVNDGSDDGSVELCDKYSLSDLKIKVINAKNGGASSARNIGVSAATGEYISFIDADDFVTDDYIEYLLDLIIAENADVACCGYSTVAGGPIEKDERIIKPQTMSGYEACKFFLKGNMLHVVMMKLIKSNIAKNVIFPNGHINEDESTAYLYFYFAEKVVISDKKNYGYFSNPSGVTNTNHIKGKRKDDYIWNLMERGSFLAKSKETELARISNNVLLRYLMNDSAKYSGRSDREIKELFKGNIFSKYYSLEIKVLYIVFLISPKLYLKCKSFL